MNKEKASNLKMQYIKIFELSSILSLIFHITLFQVSKKIKIKTIEKNLSLEAIQVEEIPATEQERSAPSPARPSVPIASEDETLPEDETIDFTNLNLNDEPLPPPPPPDIDEDMPIFIPHDEPPMPIGGYAAIQRNIIYPEIAQRAGIEGTVMIQAKIGIDGNVKKIVVMKSLGPNGCDEAAIRAINSVKWRPAKQRDKPVEVWAAVPVIFRLN